MNRQKGFTLIEIIMAIVLLGIIATGFGIFISQQAQGVVRSQEYTTALNLGRKEQELVKSLAYANIVSLTTSNYDNYPFDVIRTVSYVFGTDATAESLKKVVISVRVTGTARDLFTSTTYIAKNASFGL